MILNDFIRRANTIIYEYSEPLKYLYSRGLTNEDINTFSIGYTRIASIKDDKSEDYRNLAEDTYNFKYLQNKIIFPLKNMLGAVNGLCIRDLEQKRYNQIFLKEAKDIGAFFGLYEALPYIRKNNIVFVHEGAFNSISFSKIFPNTVSSLTSFMNEGQYEQLIMLCDKIVLVYDDDPAGHTGERKMKEYYGTKNIETVVIGVEDSNKYHTMLGLKRFTDYIKTKIPTYLQGQS